MHFLWNFAFKFLGFVHNWKQKYNQNTVRRTEIKDFGVWWEAGNTKNLAAESVLQRLPGQGGLESYISNQTAGCFTSQTEFHYFAYLSLFLSLLFKTTFPYFKERKKKNIPLIQNLWNKHLSGTHCCWLLFRWCIFREDHQSNSRLQLVHCCSDNCFSKNTAYKQMVIKETHHFC